MCVSPYTLYCFENQVVCNTPSWGRKGRPHFLSLKLPRWGWGWGSVEPGLQEKVGFRFHEVIPGKLMGKATNESEE